jgi:threonine aldolase
MRQAGVIAAAGLVALRTGIDRLSEDHDRARRLAESLTGVPGLAVDPARVQTNFVMVGTAGFGLTAEQTAHELDRRGIRASARPPYTVRFVTHRMIGDTEVEQLVAAMHDICRAL